ncbi:MAG: methanol oxidation system protein MoxJ [Methyloversatilis sp.]|jgi:mxaJ protein|uniref:methanol oxidation system protein MoxJ n=1 Tax=Methyloversatilis TaxID=378210 RepID=UPI0025D2C64D|nr:MULTISPECIES: methanol oxidation system protein MoxJ [Methyloversatilis]MBV5285712.1 methanol oxidation system protein MoxJ [Methyloversatilis discipulorum]MCR6665913.1 methanol oxidation system protein MoxJ [Methyloversatilis sp.]
MKQTLIAALLCALGSVAHAAGTLKVCAADNEMPYANERGEGFEDRIAEKLAAAMDMKLERVGFSDPRYVVRDLLDKGKCDVMLGVDAGDPRVATTRAYYRSSYVFVTRADFGQEVTGWDSPALQTAHIGVIPGTPAEVMLVQLGRYADSFRYMMSLGGNKAPRNRYVRYDSEKLIRDLAAGEIDVAVAWAPSVARYIKSAATPLKVTQVPAQASKSNGEPVHFHFDTAIAVRKDDHALLARIEAALARSRDDIEGVLRAEGIQILPPHPVAEGNKDSKG